LAAFLEDISIQRKGGLFYTSGYRKLVVAAELVYVLIGAGLSVLATTIFGEVIAGIVLFSLVLLFAMLLWAPFQALLWFFGRESRQSVDITREGVLETVDGRQKSFIPWSGVTDIELNATVVAGASLRIKSNFSEISISNVDLVITETNTIQQMNNLLRQAGPMRELAAQVMARAPGCTRQTARSTIARPLPIAGSAG
jgi:glucose dehydrogenase